MVDKEQPQEHLPEMSLSEQGQSAEQKKGKFRSEKAQQLFEQKKQKEEEKLLKKANNAYRSLLGIGILSLVISLFMLLAFFVGGLNIPYYMLLFVFLFLYGLGLIFCSIAAKRGHSAGVTFIVVIFFLSTILNAIDLYFSWGNSNGGAVIVGILFFLVLARNRKEMLALKSKEGLFEKKFPHPESGKLFSIAGIVIVLISLVVVFSSQIYVSQMAEDAQAKITAFENIFKQEEPLFLSSLESWGNTLDEEGYVKVRETFDTLKAATEALDVSENPILTRQKELYLQALAHYDKGIELFRKKHYSSIAEGQKEFEAGDRLRQELFSLGNQKNQQ